MVKILPTLSIKKQLSIVIHQTRDQAAIDLFLFLLVFSFLEKVLSLLVLDFYSWGHLDNPHFLSAPLPVVHPLVDALRLSGRVLWNHSCPSVCLCFRWSVRTSQNFLKIGSLVFSDIVHDDNWPWYLVTDEARFLKKNFWRPKSGPKWGYSVFLNLDFF